MTMSLEESIDHIRPRFVLLAPMNKDEILQRIKSMLKESHPHMKGKVVQNHVIIDVEESEAHFWSPQMSFRVEEDEEDPSYSRIIGLIGPKPTVWTLFMFFYFAIGGAGFVAFSYGVSKYLMGEHSNLIWALPIAIIFMLTAFLAGRSGEKLGHDQIEVQKEFVKEVLNHDYTVILDS